MMKRIGQNLLVKILLNIEIMQTLKLNLMNKYSKLFFFFLALNHYSCNNNKAQYKETIDFSQLEQKELIIDNHFSVKKIVLLETTLESQIVYISKVFSSEDKIIILDNFGKSILFFDANGKFISRISRIGRGPGEYIGLSDMMVNFENETICVLDGCDTRKMIYYSFSGDFLKEISIDMCADSFYRLNDGSYVFFVPTDNNLADNKTPQYTSIIVTDSLMQYKWSALPFNPNWEGRGLSSCLVNSTFFPKKNKTLFLPQLPHSINTIYEVTLTSVKPYLNITIQDNQRLNKLINDINPEGDVYGELSKSGLYFNLHNFVENQNGLFFTIVKGNGKNTTYYNVFHSRGSNHYFFQSTLYKNPRHGFFLPYPITTANGSLIMVNEITPTQLLDNKFEIFEHLKNEVQIGDNPILVFYNFKPDVNQ